MFNVHRVALFAVVLLAAMTVGCQKTVELRINNLRTEPITVHLEVDVPSGGWEDLGPIPPMAMLKFNLKVDNNDLPAGCNATDGKHKVEFIVTEKMTSPQYIDFKPWGALIRDKYTKVDEKVEVKIKKIPIETKEVIE